MKPGVGKMGDVGKALLDRGSPTFPASSFQAVRSTIGMVIASQGTTGFLERKSTFAFFSKGRYQTDINVGVLKARGCIELMLSPLSQVILARLAFRSSPSWTSVNGAGLAADS